MGGSDGQTHVIEPRDICGDWFTESFSQDYLRIYRHRDFSEAEAAIRGLLARLNLPLGVKGLDLGCGFGRHLAYLNAHGVDSIGLDLSADLLAVANETPGCRGRLIRADMRAIPLAAASRDFVFSFFSSFGYFARDEENERVIREIGRIMRPGGGFVLDYLNAEYLERRLVPADVQQFDDFTLRQRRYIDHASNTIVKEMVMSDTAGERTYHECVKLYRQGDFARFCERAGFRPRQWWGDYEGSPPSPDLPRLILWAEKL